jgi:tetratricopeptide (TPR) repeat protein
LEQHVGPDGVGVQIDGNSNTVTIYASAARLTLERRHRAKAPPATERDLLLTEWRATDLVGRDDDLKVLTAWLEGPRAITARCLIARAGTGKTRLAIELCERAEDAGWTAGFARHEELRRFSDAQSLTGWVWPKKTLVVVDYAAASATILRQWLEALARRQPPEHRLRMLLLERHADAEMGWWADLARPGGLSGAGPDALLDPPEPVALRSLARVEARRAVLAQAMREAARVLGKTPAPELPPPGADAEFERRLGDDAISNEPLYLIMAGLVAVTTGARAAPSTSRLDPVKRVAKAERARLDRLAAGAGINASLFRHLAACVTLQGGCGREAAMRLVKKERDALDDKSTAWHDELVAHLVTALPLPGSGDVDAVRPDLIGEMFVLQHLTADGRTPEQQGAIVARAFGRAGMPVVRAVIRAALDLAEGNPEHATAAWLGRLAGETNDVVVLMAIASELPPSTLALRKPAAAITERIVEQLRASATSDPERVPELAGWLNNLSQRLSDLGRREEALAAIEEAVELYRVLAAARPDAFRPNLALSLNNLSNAVSAFDRGVEALAAIEEAVAIRRELAAARPDAFCPDLAESLSNLSGRSAALGQREEALAAIEEAVELYRALAKARPDAFRPKLAASLNNLSNALSALGRREEALAAIKEAVAIRHELAAAWPDAFRPDFAGSLNNLSKALSALGRREEALAAIEEAVAIRRELAEAWPDAFRPDLAASLINLSDCSAALGRRDAALAAIEEAVALYRALAKAPPDAFRTNLAVSLWVLAGRLDENGNAAGGVAANAEAIAVLREPLLRRPAAFAPHMAGLVREYRERCKKLGREPDGELLAPVLAALQALDRERPSGEGA